MTRTARQDAGGDWITFAGVMFVAAAVFNIVYGIAAFANDEYFVADELLFGDLAMWGAVYLFVAACQSGTALLIFSRSSAGAVIGILLASVNATLALASIGAYPIWSIAVMVIDVLIIYALTVHGFSDE